MKCMHVFISGKVQGVFFRATCSEEANRLGISGWVENLPEKETVEKMIHWCYSGSLGRVKSIEQIEEPARNIIKLFS